MAFTPPTPKVLRSPARYLWWLVTSQRGRVAAGATLGIVWMTGLTVPPYLLGRAVGDGLRAHDTARLMLWTGALFAVSVAEALIGVARHRTMTRVRMDASFRTVRAVVHQTTELGAALRRHIGTGEIVAIGMSDVTTVARSLTVMGPGVGAVVGYVVVAALLLRISPLLAGVVLAGVPLVALTVGPLQRRLHQVGAGYRRQQGELTALLVDVVSGLRVLGGLGGKEVYAERYARRSRRLLAQGYRVGAVTSWLGALATGLPALFLALVTWLAARMAAAGSITIGDLVTVYGYTAMLVVPVALFIEGSGDIARGLVSARRITAFLTLPPAHADRVAVVDPPPGPAVLHDPVSGVTVAPGALTAIAAADPSEANAVLERLARFTPSTATWGELPVSDVPLAAVRERVLLADNDAALFSGTLAEAVAGRDGTGGAGSADTDAGTDADERVRAAVHAAVADDVVDAVFGGLAGRLTSGGRNLSGGQRQRIRLARALYAAPEVLLAAEPTSAVDALTEAEMAARLRAARSGLTTLVTTTSPLVLEHADTVVHLAAGRVAATGTHRELLRTHPPYRALVTRDAEPDDAEPDDAEPVDAGPDRIEPDCPEPDRIGPDDAEPALTEGGGGR